MSSLTRFDDLMTIVDAIVAYPHHNHNIDALGLNSDLRLLTSDIHANMTGQSFHIRISSARDAIRDFVKHRMHDREQAKQIMDKIQTCFPRPDSEIW